MTAQIHETLILDGKKKSMAFCPPLPEDHPRIIRKEVQSWSTDNWRGYRGSWEIKDGRFYLTSLTGNHKLTGDKPLFADWFTGTLRIPGGELLEYVHMGFGSVFEQELHIHIRAGEVTASHVIDNRGKEHDRGNLTRQNMPGLENKFPGDDDFD